jgi:hypothetical protein
VSAALRARPVRRAVARCGRLFFVLALTLWAPPHALRAQLPAVAPDAPSSVDGRVMRPGKRDLVPVGGVWVTLHRVGSDHAGPIDSMRVGPGGHFRFRYARTGRADAIYFASASYDGIAYFTRPLMAPVVSGDDAAIIVFDTTSAVFPLAVKGRHIVIASPRVDGSREVVEAYEIANESDRTLVSPDDAHPSWTTPLPTGVTRIQVGESDISPSAVTTAGGRVVVFAPFAPGLKQLSFSYEVPQSAFPLRIPIAGGVTVLEVLLEESKATAAGASLKRVAPAAVQGRVFQRFLASDAPAASTVEVTVPVIQPPASARLYRGIAIALATLMVAALIAWRIRGDRARRVDAAPVAAPLPDAAEALARAIASLDAEFERAGAPDAASRAAYEEERRALKHELASALDAPERLP